MMNISIVLSVLLVAIHCAKPEDQINKTDNIYPLPLTKSNQFTAGNTKCRGNEDCGYHKGTKYSWCYTDYSDNWDYCCTTRCGYDGEEYLWCQSGDQWQYCGNNRTTDVQGRSCLKTYPCGVHKNELRSIDRYYWCYVDLNGTFDVCCAPHSPCLKRVSRTPWCYVGVSKLNKAWVRCKP
ncbi:hypothetical protein ACJMK2_021545 [Sinanodonta woodiana]|uniref:Uncharacterized protein n=1 Tax=Sinanodonta woodiana TaxID=1069815 RepID=A0ABD3TID3_SINWO